MASQVAMVMEAGERLSSVACMTLGPCFVALGMGLVATVAYIALFGADPLVPRDRPLLEQAAVTAPGLWLLFNVYFNWGMCARTKPGKTPRWFTGKPETAESRKAAEGGGGVTNRRLPSEDAAAAALPAAHEPKRCRKCDFPKPARAHHCGICDECVLAMDHHCPWVNNCVGFYNYRYFYLFLLYLWLATLYVVLSTFHYHYVLIEFGLHRYWYDASAVQEMNSQRRHGELRMGAGLAFAVLLCAAVWASVSLLLGFHTYLVWSGQTTIEFYQNRSAARRSRFDGRIFVNDFDLGKTRNWENIFGRSNYPLAWMRPSTRKPPGDGLSWPTCKSVLFQKHNQIV